MCLPLYTHICSPTVCPVQHSHVITSTGTLCSPAPHLYRHIGCTDTQKPPARKNHWHITRTSTSGAPVSGICHLTSGCHGLSCAPAGVIRRTIITMSNALPYLVNGKMSSIVRRHMQSNGMSSTAFAFRCTSRHLDVYSKYVYTLCFYNIYICLALIWGEWRHYHWRRRFPTAPYLSASSISSRREF
jgi:hypothetical protein